MPTPSGPDDPWTVPDVYLLTESKDGRVAVPHLALTFLDDGILLGKADGESIWSAEWKELGEMSTAERSVLPDGRDGVVMVVTERRTHRRHRFVLPTDDADSTEESIRGRARDHRLRTNRPKAAVSWVLTAAVIVAVAATVSALLLSATHAIHF
jgi:hypothetical protein